MKTLRVSHARVVLIIAVAIYIAVFYAAYVQLVVPVFGAWGFGLLNAPAEYLVVTVVLCMVPSFWMPLRYSRPSLLFFYIQYFLIFIPAAFIVYGSTRPAISDNAGLLLVIAMFVGLSIIQISYWIPAPAIRVFRLTPEAFWLCFTIGATVMVLYLAAKLGGHFRLVGFQDIYSLRTAMSETIGETGSRFGLYAQSLLSALVFPLIFASGIASRRYWVVLPVMLGYVFLFGIGGAKSTALAIIYLPLSALLLSRSPQRIATYFVSGLSLALAAGFLTQAFFPASLHLAYTAVVHFRFFTVPPLTLPQYYDFFQTHPVTHFANVTGFNWLLQNPYDSDIPYTIGAYFYGGPVGLNSGLWAGDGLTAFGVSGIIVVSLICAVVFWILDSASAEFAPTFTGLTLTFCTVFFGNVSLFTTLVTGGLALIILTGLIAPVDSAGRVPLPVIPHLGRLANNQETGH